MNAWTKKITQILPHRPPFLFVDKIKSFNEEDRIETELHLSPQMIFFSGHFPGQPIMPGVLVIEALAQTAGLLLGLRKKEAAPQKNPAYFLARTDIKFLQPALPGDNLLLTATLTKAFGSMYLFNTQAKNDAHLVAKGSLTLAKGKDFSRV